MGARTYQKNYYYTFENAHLNILKVPIMGKRYKFFQHSLVTLICNVKQKFFIFTSKINWKYTVTNSSNLISSNILTATSFHITFIHQKAYFNLRELALLFLHNSGLNLLARQHTRNISIEILFLATYSSLKAL